MERYLKLMEMEGRRRGAPAFSLHAFVKNDKFKLLISILLSSRSRDEVTKEAVKRLFGRFQTIKDVARADEHEIEKLIYPVGFFRVKARNIKRLARTLTELYNSKVPDSFEELVSLPGVGRKTANIFLERACNKPRIGVDTHVHRISNRLGIVKTRNERETEEKLMRIVPERLIPGFNIAFVAYGQVVCRPLKPRCGECKIKDACDYYKTLS